MRVIHADTLISFDYIPNLSGFSVGHGGCISARLKAPLALARFWGLRLSCSASATDQRGWVGGMAGNAMLDHEGLQDGGMSNIGARGITPTRGVSQARLFVSGTTTAGVMGLARNSAHSVIIARRFSNRSPRRYAASTLLSMVCASAISAASRE